MQASRSIIRERQHERERIQITHIRSVSADSKGRYRAFEERAHWENQGGGGR